MGLLSSCNRSLSVLSFQAADIMIEYWAEQAGAAVGLADQALCQEQFGNGFRYAAIVTLEVSREPILLILG